jgi:hypothetical protein
MITSAKLIIYAQVWIPQSGKIAIFAALVRSKTKSGMRMWRNW